MDASREPEHAVELAAAARPGRRSRLLGVADAHECETKTVRLHTARGIDGQQWLRSVFVNPGADVELLLAASLEAMT